VTTKLVCTVGIGDYKETTYHFGDGENRREKRTKFAQIAVGCCAIAKDLELVALLTRTAKVKHGEQLKEEAEAQGWSFVPVEIPEGKSEAELWDIFEAFGSQLEKGDELVLDLTHGFRHIPALLLSATQYYTVRKNLNLSGIFYGAWEARNGNNESPIFDLTPLYDLSEWTYGVRLLRDYQFSAPLGEMLDKVQRRSHSDPRYRPSRFTKLQKVGRPLKDLESPLVSGIPLEAGLEAHRALENAKAGEVELARIPPMMEPWRELKEQLKTFRLQGFGEKNDVSLTKEELHRQGRLIGGYLESGNLWAAANLLREWIISAVVFHSGDTGNWLSYDKQRKPVESKLGALSEWNRDERLKEALTAKQKELVGLWQRISHRRNALAHAGMKESATDFRPAAFHEAFEELRGRLEDEGFWSVEVTDMTEDLWLISPLGTTPGALFTAIKKAKPDRLLVVTSRQGKELVPKVLHAAEREDLSPYFALLDDPFNGFSEARESVRDLRREHGLDWIRAKEIIVNLTGGTTCLGWTTGQLENSLKRMSLKPGTVACIDRRSPDEQRRNPYREGEMQDIEPVEEREDE